MLPTDFNEHPPITTKTGNEAASLFISKETYVNPYLLTPLSLSHTSEHAKVNLYLQSGINNIHRTRTSK